MWLESSKTSFFDPLWSAISERLTIIKVFPNGNLEIKGQKKLVLTEFIAYSNLASATTSISDKTATIAAYALCGFANFASIGIQLGGIGSIAPERKKDLAKLVTKAMLGGALASWLTATIAGILI